MYGIQPPIMILFMIIVVAFWGVIFMAALKYLRSPTPRDDGKPKAGG
jgi:hypothetical protein